MVMPVLEFRLLSDKLISHASSCVSHAVSHRGGQEGKVARDCK